MTNKTDVLIDLLHEHLVEDYEGSDIPELNQALMQIVKLQAELGRIRYAKKGQSTQLNVHNDEFATLVAEVEAWGSDKGIIQKGDPQAQMLKCVAEVGELADGVAKNDMPEIIDGVGDVLVTLILLCKIKNINITGCLNAAYQEIKERKGQMVGGVFVKEPTSMLEVRQGEELQNGMC